MGKYDAINFGYTLVPRHSHIVVLNDVDTIPSYNLDNCYKNGHAVFDAYRR